MQEIRVGDCRALLQEMPAESVQCVVTSPPYWNLRDYGTASWVGGDPDCDHSAPWSGQAKNAGQSGVSNATRLGRKTCHHCGAERLDAQLGLEDTVEEYVEALVEVFRELRRVLRDDGVAWLNLGDTYAARWSSARSAGTPAGFKPKDLIGVPWRVALALQADGWYLRADVIWAKPNPVPESIEDRPTRAHEYVFLLTKSPRYFYDAEAIREPQVAKTLGNWSRDHHDASVRPGTYRRGYSPPEDGKRNKRSVWEIATEPYAAAHFATFPPSLVEPCVLAGCPAEVCSKCGAPWQRVLQISGETTRDRAEANGRTERAAAYPGANAQNLDFSGSHWKLPPRTRRTLGWRPTCICNAPAFVKADDLDLIFTPLGERGEDRTLEEGRAGLGQERSPDEGVRAMTRFEQRGYAEQLRDLIVGDGLITDRWDVTDDQLAHWARTDRAGARAIPPEILERWIDSGMLRRVELPTWEPPETVPPVVLDPFAGSGTVGVVCGWHGRDFVGLELSSVYALLARQRIGLYGRPGRRAKLVEPQPESQLALSVDSDPESALEALSQPAEGEGG